MNRISKKKEWILSFQVAFTYIGTVVGAGFASGQEILKFFTRYWPYSSIAIIFACILLGMLGSYMFILGSKAKARSYLDVTTRIVGRSGARIIDLSVTFMLFGVTVAMIAGVGALSQEQLHISFDLGALVTIGITSMVLLLGVRGLLIANSFIVPFMVSVIAVLFSVHLPSLADFFQPGNIGLLPDWGSLRIDSGLLQAIGSAIAYAAFNVGLSVAVLIPLGGEIQNETVLRRGAWISAGFLCFMLLAADWLMRKHFPYLLTYEVPMGELSREVGSVFQFIFLIALWAEIFSTLLSNVFGLMRNIPGSFGSFRRQAELASAFLMLLVAYGASHIGFSTIVEHVYPAFGFASFLLLLFLLLPNLFPKLFKRNPNL